LLGTRSSLVTLTDGTPASQRVVKRIIQVRVRAVPVCVERSPVLARAVARHSSTLAHTALLRSQAPVKVLFPLAPKLLAATTAGASAPALAAAALSPWLARKGVRGAAEIDALSAVNRCGRARLGWTSSRAWHGSRCQAARVCTRRASMLGFGGVAFGLGLVPLLSWVLGFTNSVGAAIFAADLERENVPLI